MQEGVGVLKPYWRVGARGVVQLHIGDSYFPEEVIIGLGRAIGAVVDLGVAGEFIILQAVGQFYPGQAAFSIKNGFSDRLLKLCTGKFKKDRMFYV